MSLLFNFIGCKLTSKITTSVEVKCLAMRQDALGLFARSVDTICKQANIEMSLMHLLFCLRDMPYKRPSVSSNVNCIISEWRGTCSGKHITAFTLLKEIGLAPKLLMRPYSIDQTSMLPHEITRQFFGRGIYDVHNFISCKIDHRDINIDITWPANLNEAGFTTTLYWDGTQNFVVAAPLGQDIEITADDNGLAEKKELLQAANSAGSLAAREEFIEALAEYSDKWVPLVSMEQTINSTLEKYWKGL